MKKLLPLLLLLCVGCARLPHKSTLFKYGKVGAEATAGAVGEQIIHQFGHCGAAWGKGYKVGINWSPEYIPNEHVKDADWPDSFVAGSGIGAEIIAAELLLRLLPPEKRNTFVYVWLGACSLNLLNYSRRGIIGHGDTDLSERRFGKNHKLAGLVSGLYGASVAYRLSKDPKVKKKVTKVKEKTKKWWGKIKVRLKGDFKSSFGVQVVLER